MKILMIAPRPFYVDRGFSIQVLEEAKALKNSGNEVMVCCYPMGEDVEGIKISRHLQIPWHKDPLKKVSFHYIYFNIFLFFHSLKCAFKFKPDIIHAHIHEGGLIGMLVGKIIRKPVVLDVQGSMLGEYKERGFPSNIIVDKTIAFIERMINRNVDGIITWVKYRINYIFKHSAIDNKKVHHFNLGMDTDLFSKVNRDKQLLRHLKIPGNRKIIGYLGLLTNYQGIDHLLEALRLILNKRKDVHLLLMGYPNIEFYKNRSLELGINEYITFTDRLPYHDAPKYLSLCSLAVSPKISLEETNGKLINYMSMGLPTVVFDTPINREILGDLGIYAKLKDSHDLARVILDSIDGNDERDLTIKLRERAVSLFSLEKMGDNLVKIYKKVANAYKSNGLHTLLFFFYLKLNGLFCYMALN
jgi:glycosyltransferase involved in cell wall biosynthesis